MADDEWVSPGAAAAIIGGISDDTIRRVLANPDHPQHQLWAGAWRRKPMSTRGDYQVLKSRALEIARGDTAQPPSTERA